VEVFVDALPAERVFASEENGFVGVVVEHFGANHTVQRVVTHVAEELLQFSAVAVKHSLAIQSIPICTIDIEYILWTVIEFCANTIDVCDY
jgi:hypothetical protein